MSVWMWALEIGLFVFYLVQSARLMWGIRAITRNGVSSWKLYSSIPLTGAVVMSLSNLLVRSTDGDPYATLLSGMHTGGMGLFALCSLVYVVQYHRLNVRGE